MTVYWNQFLAIMAIATVALPFGNTLSFQDEEKEATVVVVNQDGEEINTERLKMKIRALTEQDGVDGKSKTRIQAGDGKLIIIDENGEQREIDVSDAKSIIVSHSVQSKIENGDKTTEVVGKAFVVGPDGVRHEYDLGAPLDLGDGFGKVLTLPDGLGNLSKVLGELKLDGLGELEFDGNFEDLPKGLQMFDAQSGEQPRFFRFSRGNASKYMIGVTCRMLGDDLRAHLNLDEGVGIIVENTTDDSPAAKAGIQKHDILMYANQDELDSVETLVEVVKKAGEKDSKISFTVVRGGKEMSFDVKPMLRPSVEKGGMGELSDLEFNQLGPGFIVGEDENFQMQFDDRMKKMQAQMEKQMKEMQEMNRKLQKQMREQMKQLKRERDDDRDEDT